MSNMRFLICAGEASGDEHAAGVCAALRSRHPNCEIRGLAGPLSQAAGMSLDVDYRHSGGGVMGIGRVIGALRRLRATLRTIERLLHTWRPQAVLLIDFPDFNFRVAKRAKDLAVPVVYFIPPKIWAWRQSRATFLKAHCRSIALIFPFEQAFYKGLGIHQAEFVGHPFSVTLLNSPLKKQSRDEAREQLGLQPLTTIGFFPGSRMGEIDAHLPVILETWTRLKDKHQSIQGVLALPSSLNSAELTQKFRLDACGMHIVSGKALEVMRAADLGLVKSGTSNLQAAFMGLPFVMIYKAPLLFEVVGRLLVRLKQFSPVNIIRPGTIVELIQRRVCPEECARELESLLLNQELRNTTSNRLLQVVQDLTAPIADPRTPYERVAGLLEAAVSDSTPSRIPS